MMDGQERRAFLGGIARIGGLLFGGLALGRTAEAAAAPKTGGLLPPPSFLHVAINVQDIERSTKFYVEALGFERLNDIKPDAKANKIMGFPDTEIKARQLRLPGGLRTRASTPATAVAVRGCRSISDNSPSRAPAPWTDTRARPSASRLSTST